MPPPVALEDLVIPNGQTESNVIDFSKTPYQWMDEITIVSPVFPEAGLIKVNAKTGGVYGTLQSGGADIVPTTGDAMVIEVTPWAQLKITAAAVAAERTFEVSGVESR